MGGGGGGGEPEGFDKATTATTTATAAPTAATGANTAERADVSATSHPPALHVIVLGSGGGPLESNVTAFLVRSLASGWSKGSVVAVDAGVHLGAIAKILENTQPPALGQTDELSIPYTLTTGPFAGLEVPHATASANAAHIHRSLIDTYLITHPHLDHISGFVINTAGLPGSRPKRLAGLPSTIAAFKTHIFNNVIWPNLSDENNGAGLVTYMRLVEGGSPALGEGEGRGYLEICDGLAVKTWGVSHGHCIERHSHRGSASSARHGSFDASIMGPMGVGMGLANPQLISPRALAHQNSASASLGSFLSQQQREQDRIPGVGANQACAPPVGAGRAGSISTGHSTGESVCVYDSSAYFIRDVATGREVLIFGDVEPDSISLSPRNQQVWQEAAPKIAAGKLTAVFIECSYDDSQSVDRLFGHLTPRFIAEEMSVLATEVSAARIAILQQEQHGSAVAMDRSQSAGPGSDKKRKRNSIDDRSILSRRKGATPMLHGAAQATPSKSTSASHPFHHLVPNPGFHHDDPVSPKTVKPTASVPASSRRIGSGTTSFSGSSLLSEDAASTSTNITTPSAPTASAVSPRSGAISKGGSNTSTYFDSPHLATPTAELTLQDLADISTTTGTGTGNSTPLSMSASISGILPPPIMAQDAFRPQHQEPFPITLPPGRAAAAAAAAAVDGAQEILHVTQTRPSSVDDCNSNDGDDISMTSAAAHPSHQPQHPQRNGHHHHHHQHHQHHQHRVSTVEEEQEDQLESQQQEESQSQPDPSRPHHHNVLEPAGPEYAESMWYPLRGLKVVVIHVKDKLNDGPRAGDVILQELLEHEKGLRLGCEFVISEAGQDLYL